MAVSKHWQFETLISKNLTTLILILRNSYNNEKSI